MSEAILQLVVFNEFPPIDELMKVLDTLKEGGVVAFEEYIYEHYTLVMKTIPILTADFYRLRDARNPSVFQTHSKLTDVHRRRERLEDIIAYAKDYE